MSRRHHFDWCLPFTSAGDIINGNKGRDGHFARTDLTGESASAHTPFNAAPHRCSSSLPNPASAVTLASLTCTASPRRASIHYLWSMCLFCCLCVLHSGGKRWSARPRTLHPLPRSLQKLLCPWRLPVPQHPGPALLQVYTNRDLNLRNNPFLNTKTSKTWQLLICFISGVANPQLGWTSPIQSASSRVFCPTGKRTAVTCPTR